VIKHEGVRRLELLGKWFLFVGCFGILALFVGARLFSAAMFLFPWLSELAFLGLIVWCGAWVLEGFVSKGE
jgi:hypothetical protein